MKGRTLHVEGNDDLFTIANLLERNGVDMSEARRPFEIIPALTLEKLLNIIPEAVAAATDRPVGFVLDIDIPLRDRWAAVRERLRAADVLAPDVCPPDGFSGRRDDYGPESGVGVWLMPDCSTDHGTLEDLLKSLIPSGDTLWPFAQECTDDAKSKGAVFTDVHRRKASIHCWLAWQKEPGRPFGIAINAKFFGSDSPQAIAFLKWLKNLFRIENLKLV